MKTLSTSLLSLAILFGLSVSSQATVYDWSGGGGDFCGGGPGCSWISAGAGGGGTFTTDASNDIVAVTGLWEGSTVGPFPSPGYPPLKWGGPITGLLGGTFDPTGANDSVLSFDYTDGPFGPTGNVRLVFDPSGGLSWNDGFGGGPTMTDFRYFAETPIPGSLPLVVTAFGLFALWRWRKGFQMGGSQTVQKGLSLCRA